LVEERVNLQKVTAAVIIENGKVLVAQRAVNDKLALKWEFPGGKLETGETPEVCLVREIKEELNLNIAVDSLCSATMYKYDTGEIELIAYYAKIIGGEIKLNVHNDARWVDSKSLNDYDFTPADLPIVESVSKVLLLNSCL